MVAGAARKSFNGGKIFLCFCPVSLVDSVNTWWLGDQMCLTCLTIYPNYFVLVTGRKFGCAHMTPLFKTGEDNQAHVAVMISNVTCRYLRTSISIGKSNCIVDRCGTDDTQIMSRNLGLGKLLGQSFGMIRIMILSAAQSCYAI